MTGVLVAIGLVLLAVVVSWRLALGLERELIVTAVRAIVQLAVVGVLVTVVFEHAGLAAGFVALMLAAASFTSSRRLRGIARPLLPAAAAIAIGAATGLIPLLATGASVQQALRPLTRQATRGGLIPALDQTKNVGLVTLPGTFVGLILGGADPADAARIQLTVLLALLAVEVVAAATCAQLVARATERSGQRISPHS